MNNSIPSKPTCLRVFGIPELAHLICGLAETHDNANLLRVSRQLFFNILPFVWERTDAIFALVSTIPGTHLETLKGCAELRRSLTVLHFPSTLDLTRFNVYAPYIKHLEISQAAVSRIDRYINWVDFLGCTRAINLLPNLRTLRVSFPRVPKEGCYISSDTINWVTTFLSTSLLELEVPASPKFTTYEAINIWTNLDEANRLLVNVSRRCPNLRSMTVFPGDSVLGTRGLDTWTQHDVVENVAFTSTSPRTISDMSCFSQLCNLTISPFILEPRVFVALGQIPLLESLSINTIYAKHQLYDGNWDLPDHAFPSMRDLTLRFLSWKSILNICCLKPLVKQLQSVIIYPVGEHRMNQLPEIRDPSRLSELLSLLSRHNTSLTNLGVYRQEHQFHSLNFQDLVSPSCLPLTTLHLESLIIEAFPLEPFVLMFPALEDLALYSDHSVFHPSHLRKFAASLPHLRRLCIYVHFSALGELTDNDFHPLKPQPSHNLMQFESCFYVEDPRAENAEKLARYLYALWPNVNCIAGEHAPLLFFSNYIEKEERNLIRECIEELRDSYA